MISPKLGIILGLCGASLLAILNGCTLITPHTGPEILPVSPAAYYQPQTTREIAPKARDDQAGAAQILSLADCIKTALDNNPATTGSWQHSRSAAAGVERSRANYFPQVDLTIAAAKSQSAALDNQHGEAVNDNYSANFGVRYLLFDGGSRAAGVQGALAELQDANFSHNAVLQDLALQVEEAYYQLQAAKATQDLAEKTILQIQYHLEVAQARYQNGLVTKSDLLKAETEKAAADLQLVRAKSLVRIVRGRLANAMGLRPSTAIRVVPPGEKPLRQEMTDIEKLMIEASRHRPELQAALARIAKNRAAVQAAKSRYWPTISINSNYGWQDKSILPDQEQWLLGVGLSLPLFEGFDRRSAVQKSQADLAEAEARYQQLLQGIELETWTSFSQLTEATQAIDAAQSLVTSAEESVRLSEGEYKNGTVTIIDLTDAQTARSTANFKLIQARLDWHTAMAELERAIGRLFIGKRSNTL